MLSFMSRRFKGRILPAVGVSLPSLIWSFYFYMAYPALLTL